MGSVSGEEQSFIEAGQPWRCHLASRHELKRVWVKADIGITTLWHRQGNNLINCTEISLMNSYVVISMRSNSRTSFSFLMGQHSCRFGSVPILFLPSSLPPRSGCSNPHPARLSLTLPRARRGAGQSHLAQVAPLKSMPDLKEIVGWFLYESCIFFRWCF